MKILVTGSAGHLGEALMRTLRNSGDEAVGMDILESDFTDRVGSILDREFVRHCIIGADAIVHTATLHKPHVASHIRQDFIDINITGTLNLLEEAARAGLRRFVFTSTTSAFGAALVPPQGRRRRGLPRTCNRSRRIFTERPKPRQRICANCFTATRACHAWFSEPHGSFPRKTTATKFGKTLPTRMPKPMSFFSAGSILKMQ